MTIQEQLPWNQINDENMSFLKAIGVHCTTTNPPPPGLEDVQAQVDFWQKMCKIVESHGLKLTNVGLNCWDNITLGLPDRDEKIEAWCNMIRNLGKVGIQTLGYNFKPIGNFRTTSTIGQGGASYSTFGYDEFMKNPVDVPEKYISETNLLVNLKYFLERIVPAARILSTLDHFGAAVQVATE